MANTRRFREGMTAAELTLKPGIQPIAPLILGDVRLANEMAKALLAEGST